MIQIKPSYYDKFSCIMGDCQHSCCSAGWNVEVDTKSLEKYSNSKNAFLQDTTKYIHNIDNKRFLKYNNGRCIFLNDNGLCNLVIKHGNSYLCNVCRDYPRFYNFFKYRVEIGLSLDCEAVSKLILSQTENFSFESDAKHLKFTKQEELDFNERSCVFKMLQDKKTFSEKLQEIINLFSLNKNITTDNIINIIENLEWLYFNSDELVTSLKEYSEKNYFFLQDKHLENLMCYFVYRYMLNNNYKQSKKAKLEFCLLMVWLIDTISLIEIKNNSNLNNLIFVVQKICRQIEYSNKNVNFILDFFEGKII